MAGTAAVACSQQHLAQPSISTQAETNSSAAAAVAAVAACAAVAQIAAVIAQQQQASKQQQQHLAQHDMDSVRSAADLHSPLPPPHTNTHAVWSPSLLLWCGQESPSLPPPLMPVLHVCVCPIIVHHPFTATDCLCVAHMCFLTHHTTASAPARCWCCSNSTAFVIKVGVPRPARLCPGCARRLGRPAVIVKHDVAPLRGWDALERPRARAAAAADAANMQPREGCGKRLGCSRCLLWGRGGVVQHGVAQWGGRCCGSPVYLLVNAAGRPDR
jgi:hypothetical protein